MHLFFDLWKLSLYVVFLFFIFLAKVLVVVAEISLDHKLLLTFGYEVTEVEFDPVF